MHSPDGEKRGGADAASLWAPLVMHIGYAQGIIMNKIKVVIISSLLFVVIGNWGRP